MLWKRYNKRLGIRVCADEVGYRKPFSHSRWMSQPWPNREVMPNVSNDADSADEAVFLAKKWYLWYCAIRLMQNGKGRMASRYLVVHDNMGEWCY